MPKRPDAHADSTQILIDALVLDLRPVRRLWRPIWRLVVWLALVVPATAALVATAGLRPDLASRLSDSLFLTQQAVAGSMAITAAWSALAAGIPGAPCWKRWLPTAILPAWLVSISYDLLFGQSDETKLDLLSEPSAYDILEGALAGVIPTVTMLFMIRRGSRMSNLPLLWCALANSTLVVVAVRLCHPVDAAVIVLAWQTVSFVIVFAVALPGLDCSRQTWK